MLVVLLLIVWPVAEVYVAIEVAGAIGGLLTVLLLVASWPAGSWALRSQGSAAWTRFRAETAAGRPPGRSVLDGAMILIGGVLLIIPGFVLLILLGFGYGHVHLAAGRVATLAAVILLGVIPFCALGLVIGLMFDGQTAQVAQMLTLLVLAFLGGIFIPYSNLPHVMQDIGKALPSYHLVQLGWDAVAGRPLGMVHMLALAAWTAALGLIAVWRWRQESTTA